MKQYLPDRSLHHGPFHNRESDLQVLAKITEDRGPMVGI
jgi:hypothetical protein